MLELTEPIKNWLILLMSGMIGMQFCINIINGSLLLSYIFTNKKLKGNIKDLHEELDNHVMMLEGQQQNIDVLLEFLKNQETRVVFERTKDGYPRIVSITAKPVEEDMN